jgi:hypothetical protein
VLAIEVLVVLLVRLESSFIAPEYEFMTGGHDIVALVALYSVEQAPIDEHLGDEIELACDVDLVMQLSVLLKPKTKVVWCSMRLALKAFDPGRKPECCVDYFVEEVLASDDVQILTDWIVVWEPLDSIGRLVSLDEKVRDLLLVQNLEQIR